MIQLNLLPNVKLEYLKSQRVKRLMILGSLIATTASVGLVIFLSFMVYVWDKKTINDVTADIKRYNNDMGDTDELEKALTIQYQLNSITTLHKDKPVTSRLNTMLNEIVPNEVSLNEVKLDTKKNEILIKGQAPNIERVNVFTDSLKFASYQKVGTEDRKPLFSSTSLDGLNFDGKVATFSIKATYDKAVFDRASEINIEVEEGKVTTRSEVERPNPLFINAPENGGQ